MEWNCSSPFIGRGVSLVVQLVKNLLAKQETQVWSLGWEDPLEKEMADFSSILAWISMDRGAGDYSPWAPKETDMTDRLTLSHFDLWGELLSPKIDSYMEFSCVVFLTGRMGIGQFTHH